MNIDSLKKQATRLRLDVIKMIGPNKKGHYGGSMSVMDIVTALYFDVMDVDGENPKWKLRDRFILSKGHSCPAQYAALAAKGFFPYKDLTTLKNLGSSLQGHPDRNKTVGVEVNTGSLGQGLSQGNGMALSMRMDGIDSNVFVIVGDGELNEGQVWEAAMFTTANNLNNVTVIVDKNNLQATGSTCNRLNTGDLGAKFKAFGWQVINIDGHNMQEIVDALLKAKHDACPTCIVAETIKGKGIAIAENNPAFHNNSLDDDEYAMAVSDLEAML